MLKDNIHQSIKDIFKKPVSEGVTILFCMIGIITLVSLMAGFIFKMYGQADFLLMVAGQIWGCF